MSDRRQIMFEGSIAAIRGKSPAGCPYRKGSIDALVWMFGYARGERDVARTELQLAKVQLNAARQERDKARAALRALEGEGE